MVPRSCWGNVNAKSSFFKAFPARRCRGPLAALDSASGKIDPDITRDWIAKLHAEEAFLVANHDRSAVSFRNRRFGLHET